MQNYSSRRFLCAQIYHYATLAAAQARCPQPREFSFGGNPSISASLACFRDFKARPLPCIHERGELAPRIENLEPRRQAPRQTLSMRFHYLGALQWPRTYQSLNEAACSHTPASTKILSLSLQVPCAVEDRAKHHT